MISRVFLGALFCELGALFVYFCFKGTGGWGGLGDAVMAAGALALLIFLGAAAYCGLHLHLKHGRMALFAVLLAEFGFLSYMIVDPKEFWSFRSYFISTAVLVFGAFVSLWLNR